MIVLSRLRISVRVLLLGAIPLFFLGLVLVASLGAADAKDRLFYRLYDDHLVILADIMSAQRIVEQSALQEIRKYRTGWASAEGTGQVVQQQLEQAQAHWQAFSGARPRLPKTPNLPLMMRWMMHSPGRLVCIRSGLKWQVQMRCWSAS